VAWRLLGNQTIETLLPQTIRWAIGDPSDIVESGTTAGGTAGIAEGGKESKSGICDIGTDMFFV